MPHGAPRSMAADPRSSPPRTRAPGARAVLLLACALALVRLFRLGHWSLWIDEVYTWADLHHSLAGGDIFNPLGYQAIGATVELLGGTPDELALRLLPALVGVACVPLCAFAFRPLVGPWRASLAALLVALSSWHVFWSQTARFYTLAQAVSLVGVGLLARALCGDTGARRRVALTVAGVLMSAAAASFHPSAVFLLPGLCVGVWCLAGLERERRAELRPVALTMGVFAALGLLALVLVGWDVLEHHRDEKPVAGALAGVVHMVQTTSFFFTPAWIAGALFGAFDALRRREGRPLFAAVALAVALAVPLAIATRAQMTAQYVFVLLPWVALVACGPLGGGAARDAGRRALEGGYLALLVLPTVAGLALYFTVRGGERAPWRDAYHYVADRRAEGELVLGMASEIGELYLGHGSTELKSPVAVSPLAEFFPHGPRRWTRHDRRIWVVVRPQWIEGFQPEDQHMLRTWLADECRLQARFGGEMEGRDLDVLVYLRE